MCYLVLARGLRWASAAIGLGALVGVSFADAHTVWSQRAYGLGGAKLEWTDSVSLASGRVVACGTESGVRSDLVVQAWEPDGTVAWVYRYPDAGDQYAEKSAKLATNGTDVFAVGSRSLTPTTPELNVFVVKLNQNGGFLDETSFSVDSQGGDEVITGAAVNPAQAGEIFVTGYTSFGLPSVHDGWVLKLNSSLHLAWQGDLNYATRVTPTAPYPLPDGRVLVATEGDSAGITFQTTLSRYGLTGVREANFIVPNTTSAVQPVARANSGQIVFIAIDGASIEVFKLDANLSQLGSFSINDHFYNYASVFWSEAGQGLYIASDRYTEDLLDLRKYSAAGVLQWVDTPPNHTNHLGNYLLKADRFGNPVVIGNEERDDGNINFVGWCWDASGHRQWKSAFGGTQTSNDLPRAFTLDDRLRLVAVGKSMNPADQIADYKGAIWRTSQYFHREPDSVTPRNGNVVSGLVSSLADADSVGQVLRVPPGPQGSAQPIVMDYLCTFPIEVVDPSATTLSVQVAIGCNAPTARAGLALYDWTRNRWRDVAVEYISTFVQSISVSVPDPQRFIQVGTRLIKARLGVLPTRPVHPAFLTFLDQLEFRSDT